MGELQPLRYNCQSRIIKREAMLYIISLIGMAAVAVILILGLTNMARGGTPSRSQKLMRLRILFQFVAVVLVMTTLYFTAT